MGIRDTIGDIPGSYLIFDDDCLIDTICHGVVIMKWSVLELSRSTRTLRLDSIRVFDRWELDRISGVFSVEDIATQKLMDELDGTVLRIEGRFETNKQVFQYNYVPVIVRSTG